MRSGLELDGVYHRKMEKILVALFLVLSLPAFIKYHGDGSHSRAEEKGKFHFRSKHITNVFTPSFIIRIIYVPPFRILSQAFSLIHQHTSKPVAFYVSHDLPPFSRIIGSNLVS